MSQTVGRRSRETLSLIQGEVYSLCTGGQRIPWYQRLFKGAVERRTQEERGRHE